MAHRKRQWVCFHFCFLMQAKGEQITPVSEILGVIRGSRRWQFHLAQVVTTVNTLLFELSRHRSRGRRGNGVLMGEPPCGGIVAFWVTCGTCGVCIHSKAENFGKGPEPTFNGIHSLRTLHILSVLSVSKARLLQTSTLTPWALI